MQELNGIFTIVVVIMSVVIHEVSHGYAALYFGDRTAQLSGRLTLNPLKHLDPIGSVLVPFILIASHAPFPFGWARPVPYNPDNLTDRRKGTLAVASAGIAANLCVAFVFSIVIRVAVYSGIQNQAFLYIASIIVLVNIGLAFFNLIPVPPLDGSKILFSLFPQRLMYIERFLEQYAMITIVLVVLVLWNFDFISPIIFRFFTFLTGIYL